MSGQRDPQGRLASVEPTYVIAGAKPIFVQAMRLDDYWQEENLVPQFLKIDVEGGAGGVLRGAHGLIARHRPIIYMELHGPEERVQYAI